MKTKTLTLVITFLLVLFVMFFLWNRRNHFMSAGAGWGKLGIVKFSYMIGGNVNGGTKDWPPLKLALRHGGNVDVVKFLVEKGANVNFCDGEGETPLMSASLEGRTEIVEFLIKNGADISSEDKSGATSLFKASQNVKADAIILLLKNGANINHKNRDGSTPLMACVASDWSPRIKNVDVLIKNGADINAIDNKGKSALDYAIETSVKDYALEEDKKMAQEIVQMLKDHGAKTGTELNKAPPTPLTP